MSTFKHLIPCWRWFGPEDPIVLNDIVQSGAKGIVTALHHIPNGEVWSKEEIARRSVEIEENGLSWEVVESLAVHEDIKLGKAGKMEQLFDNYCQSMINLSDRGIKTITYNFMPLLDWTRTHLGYSLKDGSNALAFFWTDLTVFDVHILERKNATKSYSPEALHWARSVFETMTQNQKDKLCENIIQGLPGAEDHYTMDVFREKMGQFSNVNRAELKQNLNRFLNRVGPVAQKNDIHLCLHPDDPPFNLFGLPRIVSTLDDIKEILHMYDSEANGLCFCTGSLGVRRDNDLVTMIRELRDKIHFYHLRSVKRVAPMSFYEADHLRGDGQLAAVVHQIVLNSQRTGRIIPMRPDHGHILLGDQLRRTAPGYSNLGRLRGLAQLEGLEMGILQAQESINLS